MQHLSPDRLDIDAFRGTGLSEAKEEKESSEEEKTSPTESAHTKLTKPEKKWLRKQAEGAGVSQTEFIRRRLFSRPLEPLAKEHLLSRLTALGAQLEMMRSELEEVGENEGKETFFRWLQRIESKVKEITTDLDPRLR